MRENDFLRWIADNVPVHPRVAVNIGDDMAAVRLASTNSGQPATLALLKIDQCLDQVHFDLQKHSAAQAGQKAVNRCLSDCAAMACLPMAIMVSVALPHTGPGSGETFARGLFLACRDAAARFDCPLVGGDTALWDQRLAITVAALGQLPPTDPSSHAPPAPDRQPTVPPDHPPLPLRSGAKPDDTLFVSGALGGSILGRHLTFVPRIALAQALAKALPGPHSALHAMMDLSDGLAQDLQRLCAASHVGAMVYPGRLPIHPDAHTLSQRDHIPAGLHALADGEDYELLFAVDSQAIPQLVDVSRHTGIPLTAIGTITPTPELRLVDDQGILHPWPKGGWEHSTPP